MKKELPSMSDKELDDLFRQINENPEISYQSGDWERMKVQLDQYSPGSRIKSQGHGYKGWLVGLLVLTIFFGAGLGWNYWKDGQDEIRSMATEKTNNDLNQKNISEKTNTLNLTINNIKERDNGKSEPEISAGLSASGQTPVEQSGPTTDERKEIPFKKGGDNLIRKVERPKENILGSGVNGKIPFEGKAIAPGALLDEVKINLGEPVRIARKQINLNHGSRLSLALMFAPDVTALRLKEIKGLGNSVGLNLEYYIKPNLSINTGILYAFKTYQGGEGYYSVYQPAPNAIQGNCWILDVPINVRYYAFQRPLSRWYISGGVSTYLMLREKYGLEYNSYGKYYRKNLDLRNKNQHYLGIGNLSIGYERLLSDKLSLQIEPYLKVPVNGIGEGQINLKSAGALIGLKYNW
jgi:hypothetical protein